MKMLPSQSKERPNRPPMIFALAYLRLSIWQHMGKNPLTNRTWVLRGLRTRFLSQTQVFAYLQQGIVSVICDG